ncbi:sugar transferase [Paracoccus sp. MBLB3053]|uniref:Sugar transferase n=1 Tax=Paracoccus aurantius TaxID=3073814 RepID=A0ABU2HX84_9RHOB|nr:sugar transferase [Paracoccus sp. MBLB3053]MDS9468919.1 sugar transferase [Paracoccus sp. MBLB3053]
MTNGIKEIDGRIEVGKLVEFAEGADCLISHPDVSGVRSLTVKRLLDLSGACFILMLFGPLMLLIAGLIWARDGGPVLFGHERIGYNGRRFRCLKYRTMVRNSEEVLQSLLRRDPVTREHWYTHFKLQDDPRIIPGIGKLLRLSSLDELPQLFNVLRGEMSLVGPRPVTGEELVKYGVHRNHYLSVKPGLTGPWQIGGRSTTTYEGRVALDVWYVENAGNWTDIVILLRTARYFLTGALSGAR